MVSSRRCGRGEGREHLRVAAYSSGPHAIAVRHWRRRRSFRRRREPTASRGLTLARVSTAGSSIRTDALEALLDHGDGHDAGRSHGRSMAHWEGRRREGRKAATFLQTTFRSSGGARATRPRPALQEQKPRCGPCSHRRIHRPLVHHRTCFCRPQCVLLPSAERVSDGRWQWEDEGGVPAASMAPAIGDVDRLNRACRANTVL